MPSEKKTQSLRVHCTESLFADMARMAALEDRTLSDYAEQVFRTHLYGRVRNTITPVQWTNSSFSPEES